MAVTVRKITLWRKDAGHKPGVLAETLEPLARVGADLQAVMGYRYPGDKRKAAIEIFPVSGKKATAAAEEQGLEASEIPTLLVEGDNKPGLGYSIARAIGDAGINMSFLVAQVIGRKYSAIFGFESDADARKASNLIKKTTGTRSQKGAKKKTKQ